MKSRPNPACVRLLRVRIRVRGLAFCGRRAHAGVPPPTQQILRRESASDPDNFGIYEPPVTRTKPPSRLHVPEERQHGVRIASFSLRELLTCDLAFPDVGGSQLTNHGWEASVVPG